MEAVIHAHPPALVSFSYCSPDSRYECNSAS
ncbi:MAG: hypothetical protein ABFS16_14665 [Bacteroidota bacterium]